MIPSTPKSGPLLATADHAGQRLDNFLFARLRGTPKRMIYRWIRTGQVRVNGGRCAPDRRLEENDQIRLPPLADLTTGLDGPRSGQRTAPDPSLYADWRDRVITLFEDDALLVVNKPAGLAVHGGSGISAGLIEQLRAERDERFLELGHRLDRDTSGVLIMARSRRALLGVHEAMARRGGVQADKRYHAWVGGWWGNDGADRTLRFPLERTLTAEGERRVRVSAEGQSAETRVRLTDSVDCTGMPGWPVALSRVECRLLTGRTHQIRVHLAHIGLPLLGDRKYGNFAHNRLLEQAGLGRLYLHASRLALAHPLTGAPMVFEAPDPHYFEALPRHVAHSTRHRPEVVRG